MIEVNYFGLLALVSSSLYFRRISLPAQLNYKISPCLSSIQSGIGLLSNKLLYIRSLFLNVLNKTQFSLSIFSHKLVIQVNKKLRRNKSVATSQEFLAALIGKFQTCTKLVYSPIASKLHIKCQCQQGNIAKFYITNIRLKLKTNASYEQ